MSLQKGLIRKVKSAKYDSPASSPGKTGYVRRSPPEVKRRPFRAKSDMSSRNSKRWFLRGFESCRNSEGVIDPKMTGPQEGRTPGPVEATATGSLGSACSINDVSEMELEQQVDEIIREVEPMPDSLKPVADDMMGQSDEIEKAFAHPDSSEFEVVEKPLGLGLALSVSSTDMTEEEQGVNLVQANVAESLGGRAWELIAEERLCSAETDDVMPEAPGGQSPRVMGLPSRSRLMKLDLEGERKKLGKKSADKLKKAEEKRQKLLERKRISIQTRGVERSLTLEAEKKHESEKEEELRMVDLEMKHLSAALKREQALRDRREKLAEIAAKQCRTADQKLVDTFIEAEEKAEEMERRSKEAKDVADKMKQTAVNESGKDPDDFDLDPEIESLMVEYNI